LYHQQSQQALLAKYTQIESSDFNNVSVPNKKSGFPNDIKITTKSNNNEAEQAKEAVVWLDSIQTKKNKITPQQEENLSQMTKNGESRKEIYNGMTKEEIEVAMSILEPEIRDKMTRMVFLYNELMDISQSRKIEPGSELDQWCKESDAEVKKLFYDLAQSSLPSKLSLYRGYTLALGRVDPFAEDGWADKLFDQLPMRVNFR